MNNQLSLKIEDKTNQKLLYYKNACRKLNCLKIESFFTVNEITFCMINCEFSNLYEVGKYE